MQGLWQIECFQHTTPHCVTRLVSGYSVSFLLLSFKTGGGALRRQRAFHAQTPPRASGSPDGHARAAKTVPVKRCTQPIETSLRAGLRANYSHENAMTGCLDLDNLSVLGLSCGRICWERKPDSWRWRDS